MKCPNLLGMLNSMCRTTYSESVNSFFYEPSNFQMEEYCFRDNHSRCPYYGKGHAIEAELPLPKDLN